MEYLRTNIGGGVGKQEIINVSSTNLLYSKVNSSNSRYIRNNYGYIRSYEYKGNIVTVTTTLLEDGSFFYKTFMNMTITII